MPRKAGLTVQDLIAELSKEEAEASDDAHQWPPEVLAKVAEAGIKSYRGLWQKHRSSGRDGAGRAARVHQRGT